MTTLRSYELIWGVQKWWYPKNRWFVRENSIYEWMMTRGTPILGNHHF